MMQAAPAPVSSSAASAFESNAGHSTFSTPAAAQQRRQHRYSHRSTSLSSGSVRTARRPASPSDSPSDDTAWAQSRLRHDPMSHEQHKRRKSVAVDPSDHRANDLIGIGAVDRWSHSTTSSVASNATRRNRSSSGAVFSSWSEHALSPRQKPLQVADASPRASPQRRHVSAIQPHSLTGSPERSRRVSRVERNLSAASITVLPTLHPSNGLAEASDQERPSTTSPARSAQPAHAYNGHFDGDGVSLSNGIAKTKRVVVVRNQTAPMAIPSHRSSGSQSQETLKGVHPSPHGDHVRRTSKSSSGEGSGSHRRPRTRERAEKDKKAMLSKALQKANTAVLLDNARNYEGALEAYADACDLLTQVMELTSGEDDKRKLDAIRVTYSNRMAELRLLVQVKPTTSDEKNLPARPPSSNESMSTKSPEHSSFAVGAAPLRTGEADIAPTDSAKDIPRLSYARNDRDSFFERTMQAVESSYSDSQEATRADEPAVAGASDESANEEPPNAPVQLPPPDQSRYMPRPLSPRRPSSPRMQTQAEQDAQSKPAENAALLQRADSRDSTSWLDTIDETGSSCSDSVHSVDDQQGMHRKHIRGASGGTDPDFDAAFDAAVEAAYDEGFEPDLEARKKRLTALKLRREQDDLSNEPHRDMLSLDPDAEEEERILDDFTQDYGQGFNFDLQSKSALPRESDSSGYSRSTWQSSQQSDRATAATSLSAVAEDGLSQTQSKSAVPVAPTTRLRGESVALPPPSAPPTGALPRPPSSGNNRQSGVRSRRLSGMNPKQLKIETSPQPPEGRKRASTFHHTTSPFVEDDEDKTTVRKHDRFGDSLEPTPSELQHDSILQSPPSLEFHAALDETVGLAGKEPIEHYRPSYEEVPSDLPATRPALFRKNKSTLSLRDHAEHTVLLQSPDADSGQSLMTPMSSTFASFAAKRNQHPLTSQRANLPSLGQVTAEQQSGGGIYLFDTSLSTAQPPTSPRSPPLSPHPGQLEPCPESFLLRPFWLMRQLSQTIIHPRGGFLSNKLFVPREVWQTRGVKLRLIEDKVANCDLLTAALGRLTSVDTYDADAIMDELQSFEEVMERVQAVLAKKLGSDVGVHGTAGMFKDALSGSASTNTMNTTSEAGVTSEKAAKSTSGKSYLTSWRKLRNKSSGAPLSSSMLSQGAPKSGAEKEQHTMPSVPMTNFVPVERRGNKREARNMSFEGPNKEYMGSLARLFDGVQVLDQIARQVEDPGLKHSSPTHVGLELSIRHAAEFFGFYVCRFVLADLGVLVDKFVKRGTEWVLA